MRTNFDSEERERWYRRIAQFYSDPDNKKLIRRALPAKASGLSKYFSQANSSHGFDQWMSAKPETVWPIIDFVEKHDSSRTPFSDIANAIIALFDEDGGSSLEKYEGSYICYRPNNMPDDFGLIDGQIEIYYCDENFCWMHQHTSIQEIRGIVRKFVHKGPIFLVGGRMYLLGVGNHPEGKYFRPMIVGTNDNPRHNILSGLILTETSSDIPISSKTILVPSGMTIKDDTKRRHLMNESKSPHIVYGINKSD